MRIGIVGLPNVGKSSLFNSLTRSSAAVEAYPFTTIEANHGMSALPDPTLERLGALLAPEKLTHALIEIIDIAGLIKDAHKGEGLGNQFLGNIRGVDTIVHVVRCFADPQVVHVEGKIDPLGDIEVIETELILADLEAVDKRIERSAKLAKSGDKAVKEALQVCEAVKKALEEGRSARYVLTEETAGAVKDLNLLTAKPVIFVANVSEDDLDGKSAYAQAVKDRAEKEGEEFVVICGKIESEIAELSEEERAEFLAGLGLKFSGLDRLAAAAHRQLGLITYFTAGKKEVRAWTVERGTRAPGAAGVIHTDFERGFIRAEVIAYKDFVSLGSEAACRDKGLVRVEGKEYVVKDGDIMHFRFNV